MSKRPLYNHEEIKMMIEDGMNNKEILTAVGCSKATITLVRKKYGLYIRANSNSNDFCMTIRDIAVILGCSEYIVSASFKSGMEKMRAYCSSKGICFLDLILCR